jgi:tRNA(Ile)-lysidine synthase
MTLLQRLPLETQFDTAWPAEGWRDSHVVLGVSGGADSVAMLRATLRLKAAVGGDGQLFVAHFNHGLRADEANADEAWLTDLCRELSVPLATGLLDDPSVLASQGDGLEAAARTARYDFLRRTAERLGARYVATAHTANDQAETVLHRILRGTGLAGLRGILPTRELSPSVVVVRPLLSVTRADVLEYLNALGQDYRSDSTNANLKWTRNRLRHELLPLLRQRFNTDVDNALVRLARHANEAQQVIEGRAEQLVSKYVSVHFAPEPGGSKGPTTTSASRIHIDCRPLITEPAVVIREVCRAAWVQANWPQQALTFDHWRQLAHLATDADSPAVVNLPGNVRAYKSDQILILDRLA